MVMSMVKHSRLSRKSVPMRKVRQKRYYVTKYFEITPADFPVTWRIVGRTKHDAKRKFHAYIKNQFEWTDQSWKEFEEHNLRLATVERWLSPEELKWRHAGVKEIAKVKAEG
jgi:hypothetical protein